MWLTAVAGVRLGLVIDAWRLITNITIITDQIEEWLWSSSRQGLITFSRSIGPASTTNTTCLIKQIVGYEKVTSVITIATYQIADIRPKKYRPSVSTYTEIPSTETIGLCTVGIDTEPLDICGTMP